MGLIIFDKDSTLVRPVGPAGNQAPNNIADQILYDGVVDVCNKLKGEGHVLAVASNQGGVAFGLISREDAVAMVKDAADKIGAVLFALCACHPSGSKLGVVRDSFYRKPNPGMILYLIDALGFAPQDTIFVGDLETDRIAAIKAGVQFEWADDFFGRGENSPINDLVDSVDDDDSEYPEEDDDNEEDEDYEEEDDDEDEDEILDDEDIEDEDIEDEDDEDDDSEDD